MNKNKIALITGATSGIGESTSHKLSDQFSLILCGRNKKKLDELSNSLSKKTDVITLICYDATGAGLYYGASTLNFTT